MAERLRKQVDLKRQPLDKNRDSNKLAGLNIQNSIYEAYRIGLQVASGEVSLQGLQPQVSKSMDSRYGRYLGLGFLDLRQISGVDPKGPDDEGFCD